MAAPDDHVCMFHDHFSHFLGHFGTWQLTGQLLTPGCSPHPFHGPVDMLSATRALFHLLALAVGLAKL